MGKEKYEIFGFPLKKFIVQRYGFQKHAAEILGVDHTYLSQVINGHRKPSTRLKEKLIKEGFDAGYFAKLDGINDISDNLLDYQEMKFLYLELKRLLEEKNDVIKMLEKRITDLKGM